MSIAAEAAPELRIQLPRLHESQATIRDESRRFNVVNVGRRWGKTTLGIDEAIRVLLAGGNVAWMAPVYKLIGGEDGMWPKLVGRLPKEIIKHIDNSENTLSLTTGGKFEAWSLDKLRAEDRFRGREYDLLIVDEAAYISGLMGKFDRAIRATLVDRRGRAWFFSTPNGYNDFHALYKRGQDAEEKDWKSWTLPSRARPSFPPEEWAELLRDVDTGKLSASTFAQEYEAIFTAPEGLVYGLDRDGIAFYEPGRNVKSAPVTWAQCKWRIAAIDPGGRDPTGLVAVGVTADERHHVYFAERRAGMVSMFDMHEWLSDLHQAAPLNAVMVGETGGESMTETLRRMGWRAFKAALSPGDKGRRIQHMRSLLKTGRLTIGPAFRELFDSEVYVYLFAQRTAGQIGGDPWATVVESTEHHGELLDSTGYALTGVLDGYPGAIQGTGLRRASSAGGVRRAG